MKRKPASVADWPCPSSFVSPPAAFKDWNQMAMMQAGLAGELPQQSAEYVDAIIDSTNKLSKLIENVLDLTPVIDLGPV